MKHKTSELTGELLDMAVAKAMHVGRVNNASWKPSELWEHGGPIIDRENISLTNHAQGGMRALPEWCAKTVGRPRLHFGPTALIAAMRAYVASKLGEEVDL